MTINNGETASQIDWRIQKIKDISIRRSQEVLRDKGREMSFDDLLAAIYMKGHFDAMPQEESKSFEYADALRSALGESK